MSDKKRDYPGSQPFQLGAGRKNLTKNLRGPKSWWAAPPFNNNFTKKSKD